jgi:hypothetical protein
VELEPFFVLTYYKAVSELEGESHYYKPLEDFNARRNVVPLLLTNDERALSESEVSRHFANVNLLSKEIAADAVMDLIRNVPYGSEKEISGLHTHIKLQPRPVEPLEKARQTLEDAVAHWNAGVEAGLSPTEIRLLKTHVEGAGVALEFSRTMAGLKELLLPVTVFSFAGLQFVTVPGEIFSRLWQLNAVPICYANGYYRYIANSTAYELGYYEAMAAIIDKGQGEVFMEHTAQLLKQL